MISSCNRNRCVCEDIEIENAIKMCECVKMLFKFDRTVGSSCVCRGACYARSNGFLFLFSTFLVDSLILEVIFLFSLLLSDAGVFSIAAK